MNVNQIMEDVMLIQIAQIQSEVENVNVKLDIQVME